MKCSACGRRVPTNRKTCMYCGGGLIQDKRSGPIHCCGCFSVMEEVEREGVVIDACPACGGIWFDVGELESLVERAAIPEPYQVESFQALYKVQTPVQYIPELGPPRNCPHCNLLMGKKNYKRFSGVIVDVCRFHGLFLDARELEKIQIFLATGGAQKEQRIAKEEFEVVQKVADQEKERGRKKDRFSILGARLSKKEAEPYYELLSSLITFLRDVWL